jgi:hypothetical protein
MELRDKGKNGFLLPPELIRPTGTVPLYLKLVLLMFSVRIRALIRLTKSSGTGTFPI